MNKRVIIVLGIVILVGLFFSFSGNSLYLAPKQISPNSAPAVVAPAITAPPTSAGPVSVAPYCTTPASILQHQGINGFSVFGRTLVFSRPPSSDKLEFYDAGPDERFNTADDLGTVQAVTFPINSLIGSPKMSGPNIIFTDYDLTVGRRSLRIYSVGSDGIAGTMDDIGPSTIFTAPNNANVMEGISSYSIDGDLVTFTSTNTNPFNPISTFYQCVADANSQGTCWTSTPQQMTQSVTSMYGVSSFDGLTLPTTGLNSYFWIFRNTIAGGANRYNLYYLDQVTQQQGVLWNRPLTSNQNINDVSFPYVMVQEENPIMFGTGRIFIGDPYSSSASQISPNSVPGATSFSDLGGAIGKQASNNGDQLLAWMRSLSLSNPISTNTTNGTGSTTSAWEAVVSSYPSHRGEEINLVSGTGILPGRFFIDIDKNSIIYSDLNDIYSAECYFN